MTAVTEGAPTTMVAVTEGAPAEMAAVTLSLLLNIPHAALIKLRQ